MSNKSLIRDFKSDTSRIQILYCRDGNCTFTYNSLQLHNCMLIMPQKCFSDNFNNAISRFNLP